MKKLSFFIVMLPLFMFSCNSPDAVIWEEIEEAVAEEDVTTRFAGHDGLECVPSIASPRMCAMCGKYLGGGSSGGGGVPEEKVHENELDPPAAITLNTNVVNFSYEGGIRNIEVTSNLPWTILFTFDMDGDPFRYKQSHQYAGVATFTITCEPGETDKEATVWFGKKEPDKFEGVANLTITRTEYTDDNEILPPTEDKIGDRDSIIKIEKLK